MLKQEWKKLLGNKIMLIVIVAIIAIPTIYTTLFLGSMWDLSLIHICWKR